MASAEIYQFDAPAEYTYDSGKVVISGGKAALLDRRPANATFYNSFNTNENADWSSGIGTGSLQGTATVAGGILNMSGKANSFLNMTATSNIGIRRGCVRMKFIPRYNGNPATDGALFTRRKAAAIENNLINVRHATSGQWIVNAKDKTGVGASFGLGLWSAVKDQTYEIELNWNVDSDSGYRWWLYIDGVLFGSNTSYRDFDSDFALMQIGCNGTTLWNDPEFDVTDFLVFDQEQHTGASYTPDWSGIYEVLYDTSNPVITFNEKIMNLFTLDAFTETATKGGTDEVKYILAQALVDKYWNGAAWVNSDGTYAQSNTAAEIETNKASFLPACGCVRVKMLLHSADGSTTPEVDTVRIDYTEGVCPYQGILDTTPFHW